VNLNGLDLRVDYEQHPAFPRREFTAQLLDDQMHMVSVLFQDACGMNSTRGSDALETLRTHVFALMSNLSSQYSDEITRSFLDLVAHRSSRVLETQIKYLRQGITVGLGTSDETMRKLVSERRYVTNLSPGLLAVMKETAAPVVAQFRDRAEAGRLTRDDLSVNRGPVVRELTTLLNREFAGNGTLEAVSHLSGTPMCVGGLALELSHPESTWWRHTMPDMSAPKTMYAHLDEAIGVPKAIVYLTDVDSRNGPTSSFLGIWDEMELNPLTDAIGRIVGTVMNVGSPMHDYFDDASYHQTLGSAKFRSLFMSLPPALRFNSHIGWDVIPESALEQRLVSCEEVLLGEAGTTVVFDGGRLFHRGGLIEAGERVVCQVVFAPVATRTLRSRVGRHARRIVGRP